MGLIVPLALFHVLDFDHRGFVSNPDLRFRDPLVGIAVASLVEVRVEVVADEGAIDEEDGKAVGTGITRRPLPSWQGRENARVWVGVPVPRW